MIHNDVEVEVEVTPEVRQAAIDFLVHLVDVFVNSAIREDSQAEIIFRASTALRTIGVTEKEMEDAIYNAIASKQGVSREEYDAKNARLEEAKGELNEILAGIGGIFDRMNAEAKNG